LASANSGEIEGAHDRRNFTFGAIKPDQLPAILQDFLTKPF
jgi:hypothetical protein